MRSLMKTEGLSYTKVGILRQLYAFNRNIVYIENSNLRENIFTETEVSLKY